MEGVESIVPIMSPYKLVSRELISQDTVIDVDGVSIGGNELVVMVGPCAVESEKQLGGSSSKGQGSGSQNLKRWSL